MVRVDSRTTNSRS